MTSHLSYSEQRRVNRFWDAFARAHGYADAESIPSHMTPVDIIREEVEAPIALLDLAWKNDWLCDERVGRALRAAVIELDYQHACDLLREVLKPLIDAEVDARAKAEGVGEYFDLMAVAA